MAIQTLQSWLFTFFLFMYKSRNVIALALANPVTMSQLMVFFRSPLVESLKWKTSVLDLETILRYFWLLFVHRSASIYLSNYKMCSELFAGYSFTRALVVWFGYLFFSGIHNMGLKASTFIKMLKTSAPLCRQQTCIHILYAGNFRNTWMHTLSHYTKFTMRKEEIG